MEYSDNNVAGFYDGLTMTDTDFRRRDAFSFKQDEAGAHIQHPNEARPIHYFILLWEGGLWKRIVTETNHYDNQELNREPIWDDNGL